jgi:uncharacterized protein
LRNRLLIYLLLCQFLWSFAQNIPSKPSPARFVNDLANMFPSNQADALEAKLRIYFDSTSTQMVVVTVESLEGYDVESYAYEVASKWGIGQKGKDNGLLILVAKQERKIRIEVGYGLEGSIPDAACKQVIRQVITPRFKEGNFYAGIDQGVDQLIALASGQYKADEKEKGGGELYIFLAIIVVFVLISFLSKLSSYKKSHIGRNGLDTLTIIALLFDSFGGGGRGGGSSGGGSSSWDFGGGSFGGGGSSGDW